jgi:Ni,Fe-hydrogenase III large subunit
MTGREDYPGDKQLDLLPPDGVDWSRAEPARRVWLEEAGGDQGARLEFLADRGLRLVMADLGPGETETLHFFNPRDEETLHLKSGGEKSLLSESARYFPTAARWIELLRGGNKPESMPRAGANFISSGGLVLEVEGGRVWRVYEAWREFPQGVLYGARAGQAGSLLEESGGAEGKARAVSFLQAMEDARGMKVPAAALAIRAALLEYARMQSHLAWIGALARVLNRPRTATACAGLLGDLEEGLSQWLGNSLGGGWLVPGGLKEDFPLEAVGDAAARIESLTKGWDRVSLRALSLPVPGWAERRLQGLYKEAGGSGWVGPMARAAGLDADARLEEPCIYGAAGLEVADAGDKVGILHRILAIKVKEVGSSLDMVGCILDDLPDTPLLVKRGRGGKGEGFGRCEGPEGEVCCHVALDKGRISYAVFSLPQELNRSAALAIEGCRLDEVELLSLVWNTGACVEGTNLR